MVLRYSNIICVFKKIVTPMESVKWQGYGQEFKPSATLHCGGIPWLLAQKAKSFICCQVHWPCRHLQDHLTSLYTGDSCSLLAFLWTKGFFCLPRTLHTVSPAPKALSTTISLILLKWRHSECQLYDTFWRKPSLTFLPPRQSQVLQSNTFS